MNKKIIILFLSMFLTFSYFNIARGAEFNPGNIISDSDLTGHNSMTLAEVQEFLDKKNGALKRLKTEAADGKMQTAAEIIWSAAQEYRVSPKFLLVMLQKEQSLLEDPFPTQKQLDWAMGYGVCDSCSMNDPRIQKFKGFGKQVDEAAAAQRWYIDNTNNGWLKTVYQTYNIDGEKVYIENQATANLYNFTPHISGNYNFWLIWNKWFSQSYPDGSLLRAENENGVWLIEHGKRRPFHSKSALISRYNLNNVIEVGANELQKYEIGAPIKYANYSILTTPFGNTYLLVDDTLRKFANSEVVRTIGYNPEEFEQLAVEDMKYYKIGPPITMESAYPAGALLQNNQTGGVYFVQDGIKRPIVSRAIMDINYPHHNITAVSPEELDKFQTDEPVKLRDGELVMATGAPAVFVISNGKKRPIISGRVFEELGYKWANIRTVDEKSLALIPTGSYLDLEFKTN